MRNRLMDISVNDDVIDFNGNTVADLLEQLMPESPFAVSVNTCFVSKKTIFCLSVAAAG